MTMLGFTYEVVIGTHVDRHHVHSHIVFNSVNAETGKKYHSSPQSYYQQIRAVSDRLCREHGLSVIMEGGEKGGKSYVEWLRESKGQPTFRSMLEADLKESIEDANNLGHFFMIMEHKGYEIYHGNRLGFRLRGQERFMYPGRRNPQFTEEGIQASIAGNLAEIDAGRRPAVVYRPPYRPARRRTKYKGLVGLYLMEYSCLKTLANKHKSSIRKIIRQYKDGRTWSVPYETRNGTKRVRPVKIADCRKCQMSDVIYQRSRYNWKTTIRQRLNAHVCELCGNRTAELYEVHVIRSLKELGDSQWELAMKRKRRKTLVVCSGCHKAIHEHK